MHSTLRRDRFCTSVSGPRRGAGARVSRRWWDQEGIDLKAEKERAAEALATYSEPEAEVETETDVEAEPEVGEEERSTYSGVSGSSGAE